MNGTITRAQLVEHLPEYGGRVKGGKTVEVQFNPESLKVGYANKTQQSGGVGDQSGPNQTVGRLRATLSVDLVFDISGPRSNGVTDVRELSDPLAYFMKPKGDDDQQMYLPGVRLEWGPFHFEGVFKSFSQKLELFSSSGAPIRSLVSLTIEGQPQLFERASASAANVPGAPSAGVGGSVHAAVGIGQSLQSIASRVGRTWRELAAANGIENPRRLAPGTVLDTLRRFD